MFPISDANPTRRRPYVTMALIVVCIGVWGLWQQEPTREPVDDLVFNLEHAAIPCEVVEGRPLTLGELQATYGSLGGDDQACDVGADTTPGVPGKSIPFSILASMFMHGGWLHIGGNMLYLWIFGNNVEDHLGRVRYLLFYLVGGVVATLAHVGLDPSSTIAVVGASGAIAAVMGCYLAWFPRAPIRTILFLGLPFFTTIKAKWVLSVWLVSQFFTSPSSGVAWAAHVGGFVFGLLVGLAVRYIPTLRARAFVPAYRDVAAPWDVTGGVGDVREYRRLGRPS